ncbi:homospermidine synthase [Congregibacter sp.]|uniref:homospermidine synthase n=1 Tax=Congregibacter sp. TaxID=2744308 RepID=UPI003F6C33D0
MSAGNDAANNANKQLRRILIIAYGRNSKADSRIAAALLARLRERSIAESWWLTLIEDDALRVEHALDLRPNDLAIFIDTHLHGKAPFEFTEVLSDGEAPILPMGDLVFPADLLHALATIGRQGVFPTSFRLTLPLTGDTPTEDITPSADASITAAVDFLEKLLGNPTNEHWRSEISS